MGRETETARTGASIDPRRRRTACKGDRIERVPPTFGVLPRGTVHYVDDWQILVKWDDGRSESLRPSSGAFRIVEAWDGQPARGRSAPAQRPSRRATPLGEAEEKPSFALSAS
jgi:hypothetical protein